MTRNLPLKISKYLISFCLAILFTQNSSAVKNTEAIDSLKSTNKQGYEKALTVKEFKFPEDHGPHKSFKTEWWYFTGNLEDEKQRKFGYQLTIFRNNIDPNYSNDTKSWSSNQIYMGHFAISDIKNSKFYSYENFQRGSKELAGAEAKPLKVWLNNWEILSKKENSSFPILLNVAHGDVSLNLELLPNKKIVLQGNQGLSQKSPEAGNASYYYSFTDLLSSGEIKIKGQSFKVKGKSWMDREWSTSALSENQEGWDWFALQLSDGYDLMYYQLREKDKVSETSLGSFVSPSSIKTTIDANEIDIEVLDYYKSKESKRKYPSKWRLRIAKEDLDITITPFMENQEHQFTYSYWEGAVSIKGIHQGQKVNGKGYVELTGY